MAKLAALLAATLLLASGASALDLGTFLTDPRYTLLVQLVSASVCVRSLCRPGWGCDG